MKREAAQVPAEGGSSPSDLPSRAWKDIALSTWKESGEDNLGLVSAGVAFYAFLAFVPLLTALVLSYGLIAEPSSVVGHMSTLTSVMPQNAAEIIGEQLQSMTETAGAQKGFGLIIALGIALYGATKGATSIMTALNIAYDVSDDRSFIKKTALSFAMTGGALLALLLAILAISASNMAQDLLPALSGVTQVVIKLVFWSHAAASVVLLLAVIYRYGPNRPDAPWRWITPGSAFATLAWLAATAGFGLYVSNFGSYNATYGSLGAVIVFLTWLYLSAYIVLLGAELNSELEQRAAKPRSVTAPAPVHPARQVGAVTPPALGEVAWKSAAYSLLLSILGRPRRAGTL